MRILITGAFGFVGTNLSKAFKAPNNYLMAIDIIEPENHNFNKYYTWNNLEKVDCNSLDIIIHLAGKAHDTKNKSQAQDYFDINTGLTKKVFDLFLQSQAKKFIFFSSVKAAADIVTDDILTEDIIPNPKGPYGESKIRAEEYILEKKPKYDALNKKVYILRPCMIHGPGNKGNLNLLHQVVLKGFPWPLGAFENKRSFCSIDNLIFIIQKLMEEEIESGIYQIADDKSLSTNELIKLIAESQGKKARILKINPKLISLIAKIGDKLYLP